MSEWNHGYFASQGYSYGFYNETMPSRLYFAGLLYGIESRRSGFRYLDLGCGQGLNLLIAAALHPDSDFVGVDFMPGHIAHGRALAHAAGLNNVTFIEGDFVALAGSPELLLPEFDYVVAHGITAWISPEVREALYKLAGAVTRPGGIFYNSYNTYPGWLAMVPFQKMVLLSQLSASGIAALTETQSLFAALKSSQAAVFSAQPGLNPRIDKLRDHDPAYLVQEYNNEFWSPLWVSDVLEDVAANKFAFLGTATLTEGFDQNYPQEMRRLIASQPTVTLKEQVRDLLVNQSFRRDLYVKGNFRSWTQQVLNAISELAVLSNDNKAVPSDGEPFNFSSGAIEVKGSHESYARILSVLGPAKGPVALADLAGQTGLKLQDAAVMVAMLLQAGWAYVTSCKKEIPSTATFNNSVCNAVTLGAPYRYLAAPGAGTALQVSEIEMMLFMSHHRKLDADSLSKQIQSVLDQLGRGVIREGQPLRDPTEIDNVLKKRISSFRDNMPLWQKLGLIK